MVGLMGIWYATVEQVKTALDIAETARSDRRVRDVLASSSASIEGLLHRRFYPEVATRYFDWPNSQYARSWRLWLDSNEIISVDSIVSGGVTIPAADYILRRSDRVDSPPYTHIEIDISSSSAWSSGSTPQKSIAITGTFGHSADTTPAGALAEDLDATETGIDVTDSATIGTGTLIAVGSERMIVTGRSMLDTGQNIGADLTALANATTVAVTDGTAYHEDETILVDAERMLIVDIAGNSLIVRRGWDGSTLAAHTSGADIYAPRTLTVERGALGTTAATHTTADPITAHVVPGTVNELCIAEALTALSQGWSGYSRTAGTGDNQREASGRGLKDLRAAAYTAYGRKARIGAI